MLVGREMLVERKLVTIKVYENKGECRKQLELHVAVPQ